MLVGKGLALLLLSFRFHSNLKKLTCISCTVGLYFLPAQFSKIVQLPLTPESFFLCWTSSSGAPTRASTVPFKRWNYFTPLQSVILFIRLNICAGASHSSDPFCVQIVQKFSPRCARRAQKQLIWEEAQQNSRRPKKPLENTAFTTQQPFPYFI